MAKLRNLFQRIQERRAQRYYRRFYSKLRSAAFSLYGRGIESMIQYPIALEIIPKLALAEARKKYHLPNFEPKA